MLKNLAAKRFFYALAQAAMLGLFAIFLNLGGALAQTGDSGPGYSQGTIDYYNNLPQATRNYFTARNPDGSFDQEGTLRQMESWSPAYRDYINNLTEQDIYNLNEIAARDINAARGINGDLMNNPAVQNQYRWRAGQNAFNASGYNNSSGGGDPSLVVKSLYGQIIASDCWGCRTFGTVYDMSLGISYRFSLEIAPYVLRTIAVLLALWIVWQVGNMMTPFGGPTTEVFRNVFIKLGLFIFLAAFLSTTGYRLVWEYILAPVLGAASGISLSAVNLAQSSIGFDANSFALDADTRAGINQYCSGSIQSIQSQTSAMNDMGAAAGDMAQIGARLQCLISDIQKTVGVGVYIGALKVFGVMDAFKAAYDSQVGYTSGITDRLVGLFYGISAAADNIFTGFSLVIIFGLAVLVYPLTLINIMFRLFVVLMLAPIAIGAYLFKMTRQLPGKIFSGLLNVAFTFFFQSLVVVFCMALVQSALNIAGFSNLDQMATAISEGTASLSVITAAFWILIVAGIGCIGLMRNAAQIANDIAGNLGGTNIAGNLVQAAGLVATAAIIARSAIPRKS
ncbi:MAG: hypothetical protein AB7G80_06410 [Dongiaceae bacterium]